MAHELGRFGIAIGLIALIASSLYQLSGGVSVTDRGTVRSVFYSPSR